MSYLLDLAGVRTVYENGTEQIAAAKINFGPEFAIAYNSTNQWLDITLQGAVSAPLSPTATAAQNLATLLAAIATVNAAGSGVIELPAGTFPIAGPITPPNVPCVIRGAGMGVTILDWDNVDNLFYKPSVAGNTDHLTLQDFTIDGRWDFYQDQLPAVAPIRCYNIDDIVIEHVEITNVTWFSILLRDCERVLVTGCKVFESGRDAISCAECTFVSVVNNQIDHCGDDAIAYHVNANRPTSARQGFVCVGNRITDSKGIVALGLKRATITGNQLERIKGHAIHVGAQDPEYSSANSVVIADNTITDVFDPTTIDPELGTSALYIDVTSLGQAGTGVAVPGLPNGAGTFEPIDRAFDNILSTEPQPPSHWLSITGNVCARTLPSGVAYSSLGYGSWFSFNGYLDPTLTEAMLGSTTSRGIRIMGGLRESTISDNIIRGMAVGMLFDSQAAGQKDYENILISDNEITRCTNYGISNNPNVAGGKNVVCINNVFDGDPYHENANRGANGTWAASSTPVAINIASATGWVVRGNVFRRWCSVSDQLLAAGSDKALWQGNVWDLDPTAIGFSTSNKGIGTVPRSSVAGVARIVDSDPTSATYGQTLNVCQVERDSIPTTGKYVAGHFVQNTSPSTDTVFGWLRNTTGSSHTLGADWHVVPLFTNVASTLTISAGGAVTLASSIHAPIVQQPIDTNGGAGTDDLDTINGAASGTIVVLHAANAARTVVVKHGTGNLHLQGGDFPLSGDNRRIALISQGGSQLYEIGRSDRIEDIASLTGASNTLAIAQAGKDVRVSHSSASTLTVPANSSVAFPIGIVIPVTQTGAGSVEILAAGGVTIDIDAWSAKVTAGQYSTVFLRKVGTDEWELTGALMQLVRSIRPSQITSNQNDYSPTNWQDSEIVLLRTDASRNITGFASPEPAGTNYTYHWRHIKQVINDGSNDIVIKHESSSSSAANRVTCETGADIIVRPGSRGLLIYDNNATRWRCYHDDSVNVSVGAEPTSWNGLVKGMFIADATTVPTGNPTGGAYVYVEGNNFRVRFSDGSIRTL